MLAEENADAVILALGSRPVIPKIPGIERAVSGEDVLLGREPVGEKIIIVGGGLVGCEIAYGYAKDGKNVTIIEALDELMKTGNVPMMNKTMLLDGFEYYGTSVMTSARLKEITENGAVVRKSDGEEAVIPVDTVIMSVGYRSNPSFAAELKERGAEIYEIGDGRNDEQLSVLYRQAKYCQAMTDADIETMAELVAEDVIFTHMTGVKQTRAEYFADVKDGSLRYYTIGIENPEIEVNGDFASIHYTSVLNANAYGARGIYRMEGTHKFEKVNGKWITTNAAQEH